MISQTAEYALRAIVALAQEPGRTLLTPQIAAITKVPPAYLSKILGTLGRHGLVRSRRGVGGGFFLAKEPGLITVLEVVNAVDPLKRIERCPLDLASHGTNLCPLHRRLDDAAKWVERSFAETHIAELLSDAAGSSPLCASAHRPQGTERCDRDAVPTTGEQPKPGARIVPRG